MEIKKIFIKKWKLKIFIKIGKLEIFIKNLEI